MKFEEKLIKLRKEKVLSQEELAEKLNVTRQTISKWELGQSKPDMDTLKEMSNLFGVSIEALIDDNMNVEKNNEKAKKPRKAVLYIFVGLLVALIVALVVIIGGQKDEPKPSEENTGIFGFFENIFGIFDKVLDEADKQLGENNNTQNQFGQQFQDTVNQITQKHEKEMFNLTFENRVGTKATIFVKSALDDVNENNKKNTDHIISVVYNDKTTTDEDEIIQIKHGLEQWGEYEVSIDYDETGYVNKVTIKDIEK